MRRDVVRVHSPAIGADIEVIAYGHHGRPLIAFPSQQGRTTDWEDNGMVDAVRWLIDAGRVKVYAVSSYDSESWFDDTVPLSERARRSELWQRWLTDHVVPFIHADCQGPQEILLTGVSFGAYHAANLALKRADLFPLAICQSGVYDVHEFGGWGDYTDEVYFNDPMAYVRNADGGHLDWLRDRATLVLVCGQGQWEDTAGSLQGTLRFAEVLRAKQLRHELDVWGWDSPHDWPAWRRQIAHHLPRFC